MTAISDKPALKPAEQFGRIEIGRDGMPTARWEARALTTVNTPYGLTLAWSPETTIRKIRVHKSAYQSLSNALYDCKQMGERWLHESGMNVFGGAYGFRMNPDGKALSIHSYGLAIDFDPERNPLGQKWDGRRNMIPKDAVEILAKHGFVWGGEFETPDCGHFEYRKT